MFQISVNLGYGVATSFWFFFLVFYLDDELGLSPSESLALQVWQQQRRQQQHRAMLPSVDPPCVEMQGTLNLAPIFKPLCGIFSDNVALCGSFRRNYFM